MGFGKSGIRSEQVCMSAELLAPAGSLESAMAAIHSGADAVYMGGRNFSARAYSESALSDRDMLLEAIDECHLHDVKLYMTINILFKDRELKELFSYIKPYYEAGVDGVIVQDLGVASLIKKLFQDLPLHASTQMTVCTAAGARLLSKMGFLRLVLPRELSLEEISEIHRGCSGLQLEAFAHGAMCYCYSGACFFSSFLGGRSGNRGRCAGTCRLPYRINQSEAYYISMKDLLGLPCLSQLISAGVSSLKIEGRMKTPLYTAGVVSVYRKYLDRLYLDGRAGFEEEIKQSFQEDLRLLTELYDRGGFTDYFKKHNGGEMIALKERAFREVKEREDLYERFLTAPEYEGKKGSSLDSFNNKSYSRITLKASLSLHSGECARLTVEDDLRYPEFSIKLRHSKPVSITVMSEEAINKAESKPAGRDELIRRIQKTGGTPFVFSEIEIDMDDNIFLPVSCLNRLRRDALEAYRTKKLSKYRRHYVECKV